MTNGAGPPPNSPDCLSISAERAGRQGVADRILGEFDSLGANDPSTAPEAAISKRYIGGDCDIARPDSFGDPIIRGVKSPFDDDKLNQELRRKRSGALATTYTLTS